MIKIGKNIQMPDNDIQLKDLSAGGGASIIDGAMSAASVVAETSVTAPAGYFDNIPEGGGGGSVNSSAIIAALGYVPLSNADTIANSILFNGHDESYFANASLLTTGNISSSLLGTGTANSTTYLRGDKTWSALPVSNTSQAGIVQLVDSISNTSVVIAATANSVKVAYDTAVAAGNAALAYANAIAWSGNAAAAYANAIAYSGNAVAAYTNAVSFATTIAATAYSNAIAWSGNAAAAYSNAIAYSGNAVQAYTNAVSFTTTIAATAYTNAIAYSGNAVQAYTNALSSAASLYMPKSGGVFTGNVEPNSNTLSLGSTTARWIMWANSIVSGPISSGSLYVNNNIYTTSNTNAFTIGADPLATITTGGYVQIWGSGSANPGLIIIGNATRTLTMNATITSLTGNISVTGTLGLSGTLTANSDLFLYKTGGTNYIYYKDAFSLAKDGTGDAIVVDTNRYITTANGATFGGGVRGGGIEAFRLAHDAGYVAYANSGNSRWGYIQHNNPDFIHVNEQSGGNFYFQASGAFYSNTHVMPQSDNDKTLGGASNRWSVVYAGTGAINTSDETLKTPFEPISKEMKIAALKFVKEIGTYQWLDAVGIKGDYARIHIGLSAQKVQSILKECGVNPDKYAMFCKDELFECVSTGDFSDPDNPQSPVWKKKKKSRKQVYRYGLRYDQIILLALSAIMEKIE
jgi:Catalytic domain of bacteriophage endosialidase/Phage tail fibre repeat/Chaperone of endosialidase